VASVGRNALDTLNEISIATPRIEDRRVPGVGF
jgi:hypothetical protein